MSIFQKKKKESADTYIKMTKNAMLAEINGKRPVIDENAYEIISIEDIIKKFKAYECTTEKCANPYIITVLLSGLLITLSGISIKLNNLINLCKYPI